MHLSLVLFWGFRNLQSNHIPRYIGSDLVTYAWTGNAMSMFCEPCRARESAALNALLARVKDKDPAHQVVVAVQLENEMPGNREKGALGDQMWMEKSAVPADLTAYLVANEATLSAWLKNAWTRAGKKTAGTWTDVFGRDGERAFGVYYMGMYQEALISEAKKVLPLPFYCNAWAGESPCWPDYMDIFHVAAPSLDGMGPDSYNGDDYTAWETNVGKARRPWNSVVVPEQHQSVKSIWRAIATHGAFLRGQYYDVEGLDWLKSRQTYDLIGQMMPVLTARKGTGDLAPGDYVVVSRRIDVALSSAAGGTLEVASAESGHFADGAWVADGPAPVQNAGGAVNASSLRPAPWSR